MRAVRPIAVAALLLAAIAGIGGLVYVRVTGLRAQPTPGRIETRLARALRALAVPSDIKSRTNPVASSDADVRKGMEHFAKYCAACHGNNGGSEKTPYGSGLFPKPPDMRAVLTQELTDGELFYIIENGVRFTGMPAFGTGKEDAAGEKLAWQLVLFIRHLPRITNEEISRMEELNPF
jgi:mono/diheme cytochrome c family protein